MKDTLLRKNATEREDPGGGKGHHLLLHRLHLDLDDDGIATITFDHPGKSANVFDEATLDELGVALRAVTSLEAKGVVFTSAKPTIFLAGADLDRLAHSTDSELRDLIEKGQDLFQRIADLPVPTVAAIHGACLGGGLEMSLACDRRIASDDRSTKIGLPETQLGILPAWGGSMRLPRLVGLPVALDMILGGKPLAPKKARRIGLIDEVVPKERLLETALASLSRPAPKRKSFPLANHPLSAAVIRKITKRRLARKTRGHYPALPEAVEVVSRGARGSVRDSLLREREAVLRLARTEAARSLMRLYFLQERARKFTYDENEKRKGLVPVKETAVIGAGVMGSGIAQWFAARGFPVILRDIDPDRVAAGMETVRGLFRSAVKRRIFTRHEADWKLDLVSPSAEAVPLRCDLVVEAAVEDLEVKKKIFADLSARTSSDTILATNTSALPISELGDAPGVTHPERIVGLHFFNPVSRMKLVEVVVTDRTSPETVERALAFVRRIGKLPVVVKDSPGFLVNRILMPYLIEAGRLVDLGHSPERIDEAMLDFGMPMGPIRLLDEIGLDVASHVASTMSEAFGGRFEIPEVLDQLVREGHLGRKTGRGFYDHRGKRPTRLASSGRHPERMTSNEIADRLAGQMVDEARLCLEEGVAASPDDIDFAMILGTGFAPFRGGPLTWDATQSSS